MNRHPYPNPEILGHILLLQTTLHAMPDEARLLQALMRGLSRIPEISGSAVCLDGKIHHSNIPSITSGGICGHFHETNKSNDPCAGPCPMALSETLESIPIHTGNNSYGGLIVQISDPEGYAPVAPYLLNTANIIALNIENRRTREALETLNQDLEQQVRDRTARLESSESWFKHVFHGSKDAIFITDEDGRFVDVNQAAENLTGYTRDELLTMGIPDLHDTVDQGPYHKFFSRIMSGENITSEAMLLLKNGTKMAVDFSNSRIEVNGRYYMHTLARDITEKLRMVEDLRQSHKMEAIGTLAGGIAHDFNNMLGILMGNAELAMDDIPDWLPTRKNLDEIRTTCLRAKEVVQQILSFSRPGDSRQQSIHLGSVVRESLKLLRTSIPANIEIVQALPKDIYRVQGNAGQIHQVMINLCTNAVHAMGKETGILGCRLRPSDGGEKEMPNLPPGEYAVLSISDTGCGMEPQVMNRIFDPYFTTKEVNKGTGMGLAVVHGIMKGHGGAITVNSEPGKGTEFTLFFPLLEAIEEKPSGDPPIIPSGDERILFVDDETHLAKIGLQMLKRLGYRVEAFTDPTEALERVRSDPDRFDLVVTDMSMPKMTGATLATKLMEIRPGLPIIISTGFSERMDEDRALEMGIRAYLEKPLTQADLSNAIRRILD